MTRRTITSIEEARAIADDIRPMWPERAAAIDARIADVESGKRDAMNLEVGITYRLEKFEGDIVPGKQPYETIEGQG